jgi:mono/diheme cytochrome c family protein
MPSRYLLPLFLAVASYAVAQDNATEFFEARIRPVLADKCYACHTASKLGDLRLDSRDAMLQGGKSGPALVPGKPDESRLIRAVKHVDQRLKMPMAGDKLSEREIADLSQWIQAGAPWPEPAATSKPADAKKGFAITAEQKAFWSFQPLRKPPLPEVKDAGWTKNPVDRFILARLEAKGLKPVKPADKRVLLRRASYDLTGLPPTPEQVDAFLADNSPDAFAKVVDRLLASPHYGERWGRHWLDVARYADGDGRPDRRPVFIGYGTARDGYVNTWRYRDWVIDALNRDMPYDLFVKAQIAADLMPGDRKNLLPGLGFFGLGPWFTGDDVVFVEARANERDDKIDALSKGFLGLTATCARCHDHKYDPISQKDYYALGGVFWNSGYWEYNLASDDEVARYKAQWKKIKAQQAAIEDFADEIAIQVAETLAAQASRYMMAVRKVLMSNPTDLTKLAAEEKLDLETLQRWVKYLAEPALREHRYLRDWDTLMAGGGGSEEEARRLAKQFRQLLLAVIAEKKAVNAANEELKRSYKPDPNEASASLPGDLMQFEMFQFKQSMVQKVVETEKYYVWLDVVQGEPGSPDYPRREAIFEYPGKKLLRFLSAEQKGKLEAMEAELAALEKALPAEYPYLMGLADNGKVENVKLNIRGNPHALGDEIPRGFPAILAGTSGEPAPFTNGSGRLELAEAIVRHPLAARVMANRIWMHHFGRGIVTTPSNFGTMGDRPTHPELLEYLAHRLVEKDWSLKAMHREIMLSAAYQLGYEQAEPNATTDPDNKLFWRANLRRLDAEALRDSLLFVSGNLDASCGGPPQELASLENKKRTVYGRIRRSPDGMLALFDFPDPTVSGDQRSATNVPLQGLFFLNSDLVWRQAELLVKRLGSEGDVPKIHRAYRLLYGRQATEAEVQRGLRFLEQGDWRQYAQVLLSAGEFYYLN